MDNKQLKNELDMAWLYVELYKDIVDRYKQISEKYREQLLRAMADRDTYMGLYEDVTSSGHDCNHCGNQDCGYWPNPGQIMRYNCPLWQAKEG